MRSRTFSTRGPGEIKHVSQLDELISISTLDARAHDAEKPDLDGASIAPAADSGAEACSAITEVDYPHQPQGGWGQWDVK